MALRFRKQDLIAYWVTLVLAHASVASAQVRVVPGNLATGQDPYAHEFSDQYSSDQYSQAEATRAYVGDPIRELEARVESMQRQLDSIGSIGSCCEESVCKKPSAAGFYGGAAVVFAKPHFKEAFQHSSTNVLTGQQTLVPFEYGYETTPRIWLGYKGAAGFGIRVSHWNFDADGQTRTNVADGFNIYGAHAVSVIFPANILAAVPGEVLQSSDSLKTQVFNYYGTYDTNVGSLELSGGIGLRNARLEQSLNSVVLNSAAAPIRQLSWKRVYEGLGPSAMIDAKKRLGCSSFSAVTQAGGALLFGKKSLNRTVLGDQSPQPATPFLALEDADEVVGIGELNFGLEWSRKLASGYSFNVRGLYEGQLWAEAGAPTIGFLGFEGFGIQAELKR